jgi:hypothetical protein
MQTDETLNAWAANYTDSEDVGYSVGEQGLFTAHPEVAFAVLAVLAEDGYDFRVQLMGEDAEVEVVKDGRTVAMSEGSRTDIARLMVQAAYDAENGETEDTEPEDDMDDSMESEAEDGEDA